MEVGMQPGDRFFKSSAWGVIALCGKCASEMEGEIDTHVHSKKWVEISKEEAELALERQTGAGVVLAYCDNCGDPLSHIIPAREIRKPKRNTR
jgi:exosome complex RNA-binding protein Csl4